MNPKGLWPSLGFLAIILVLLGCQTLRTAKAVSRNNPGTVPGLHEPTPLQATKQPRWRVDLLKLSDSEFVLALKQMGTNGISSWGEAIPTKSLWMAFADFATSKLATSNQIAQYAACRSTNGITDWSSSNLFALWRRDCWVAPKHLYFTVTPDPSAWPGRVLQAKAPGGVWADVAVWTGPTNVQAMSDFKSGTEFRNRLQP